MTALVPRRGLLLCALLMLGRPWTTAQAATAHPLHAATLLLQHDPAARQLTGTLRVFSDDLRAAAGGADSARIVRYVRQRVRWIGPDGSAAALVIGRPGEDGPATLVPILVPGVATLGGWRVALQVLSERFADQVNVVRVRAPSGEQSLLFLPADGPRAVRP